MSRTVTVVGAAVIAIVGAVAASHAQGRPSPQAAGEQRGGRPEFDCGPAQDANRQAPPQGAMRGRGQDGQRPAGVGRPGGPGRGGPGMGGRGNPLCGLDLTEEQKTQIAAIQQKSREDIEAVLTPEQREKLHARRGGR